MISISNNDMPKIGIHHQLAAHCKSFLHLSLFDPVHDTIVSLLGCRQKEELLFLGKQVREV